MTPDSGPLTGHMAINNQTRQYIQTTTRGLLHVLQRVNTLKQHEYEIEPSQCSQWNQQPVPMKQPTKTSSFPMAAEAKTQSFLFIYSQKHHHTKTLQWLYQIIARPPSLPQTDVNKPKQTQNKQIHSAVNSHNFVARFLSNTENPTYSLPWRPGGEEPCS